MGCYVEDSPEDVVLVRVYGNKTELIVDRDNELKSFQVKGGSLIDNGKNTKKWLYRLTWDEVIFVKINPWAGYGPCNPT